MKSLKCNYLFNPLVDGTTLLASNWEKVPPVADSPPVHKVLASYGRSRGRYGQTYYEFASVVDFRCAYEELVGAVCPISLPEAVAGYDHCAFILDGRVIMTYACPGDEGMCFIKGFCLGDDEPQRTVTAKKAG